MSKLYGVSVVFNERGYWSKAYTYLSDKPIEKNTIVVVETQHFYSVGKVNYCIENPELKEGIKYKYVKHVLSEI